jgi:LPS-assembly lipoprotein
MKTLFVVSVVLLLMALNSCGYHLRGAYQLPPQMAITVLKSDKMNGELVRGLKRALETSGIFVVDETGYKQTTAVLRIVDETHKKRVLSVDINGRVREYALHYAVTITLSGPNGLFVPGQTLELSRDFIFDPVDVLGKSDEEADLLLDMQHDMVRLIMLRLQAATQTPVTSVETPPAP